MNTNENSLIQAVTDNPNDDVAWAALARNYYDSQQMEKAVFAIQKAISINGEKKVYYHQFGSILISLQIWQEAIPLYQFLIEKDPENPLVYCNLGVALMNCGHLNEAVSCYQHAIKLNPDNERVHYNLATVLQSLNQLETAESHFHQALKLNASFLEAAYNLGTLYMKKKEFQTAIDVLRYADNISPNRLMVLRNLGYSLRSANQVEESISVYQRLIEVAPDDYINHYDLGVTLAGAGKYSDAIASLQQSIQLNSAHLPAYDNLVNAYAKTENFDQAHHWGLLSLTHKDQLSLSEQSSDYRLKQVKTERARNKNIISFSLWGDQPTYLLGAIENVRLAKIYFPGWLCRFYMDATVPADIVNNLTQLGAEIMMMPSGDEHSGLFWRFFVANDLDVHYFLVRDCDSRIGEREHAAVDEWIASGQLFHIMRDDYVHTELILAGMWGGVAGLLPDIEAIAQQFYSSADERWSDQLFLQKMIWPLVKDHCLIHDAYYKLFDARSFPTGDDAEPKDRVAISHKLTKI